MTNQEQYNLICEKAKKYDRLIGLFDKLISEIIIHRRKTQRIDTYDLVGSCLDIIKKYKAESEE